MKISALILSLLLMVDMTACPHWSLFSRSVDSQLKPIENSHKDMQYIVWPKTLIFVAIDFIIPKRQY